MECTNLITPLFEMLYTIFKIAEFIMFVLLMKDIIVLSKYNTLLRRTIPESVKEKIGIKIFKHYGYTYSHHKLGIYTHTIYPDDSDEMVELKNNILALEPRGLLKFIVMIIILPVLFGAALLLGYYYCG